jgi:protein-tyrosine phosphatase
MPQLLFLCTGNYYRSRFAEEVWNHLERRQPTGWSAISRGLYAACPDNLGPISIHTLDGLAERGIELAAPRRAPKQLELADLESAALVVAMSDREHRPMLRSAFPAWTGAVEYWDIDDVDRSPARPALEKLTANLRALRERLTSRREA